MAQQTVQQNYPQSPTSAFVDDQGRITSAWNQLLISLWQRTGAANGGTSAMLDQLGSVVPGVTLFRGPALWQFLSIGTSGQLYTVSPTLRPQWESLSSLIDRDFGNTPGNIIYRNASRWTVLAPGQIGTLLASDGGQLPAWQGLSTVLDFAIGSATGDLIVRQITGWGPLGPGTPGQVLTMSGGLPVWTTPTVTPSIILTTFTGVNFNLATTDTTMNIALTAGYSRYQFNGLYISAASHSLTSATCGVFSSAGGAGTVVVSSNTAITVSTTAENTTSNMQILSPVDSTRSWNFNPLFFRVQTAEGTAATGTITLEVTPVS